MLLKLTQVNFFQERSLRPFIKHAQCLFSSISVKERGIVGIRREDINVWERRAPFAPQHVKELNDQGIDVLVQPSTRRAYTMEEYQSAGAFIQEDLSPASVIMAVKQVPIDILIPNKSYAFFSHTIKAQEANMALLDAMLEKNIRIIDYEKMVDGKGRRVAAFGKFAGVGGMINVLHGLGLRLLSLGHHTPFMYVGSTHNYKNSRQARLSIYELGEDIRAGKLPSHFGPLVFVFTGSGNVSQGAQEVFGELPHVYVHPLDLQEALKQYDHRTLVATKVSRHHYLVPKHGGEFNAQEFEEFPSRYRSIFAEKIAPFASVIINGIYWAPSNPRLLTNADGYNLLKIKNRPDKYGGCPDLPHRLLAICDISADLGGSIEFMKECTTIEYPFALYNSENDLTEIGVAGDGLMFCSIDNIPAQLPREATDYFGKLLLPWIPEMVEGDARKPFIEETCYSNVVRGAVICSNGRLTDDYKYIMELRAENEKKKTDQENGTSVSEMKHRVLVVGAGRVSAPLIEYLTRDPGVRITSVSSLFDEVEQLAAEYNNVHPIVMDVQKSQDRLSKLISEHDLVISLLPYSLHPLVAEHCIAHRKNMMTASYVTPEMKALEPRMEEAGITVMQECGLDPGIDHMLAMQCFDQVKRQNGRVDSFMSYCGGLPAPEDAGNPMRYKFSWSPRGSLLTAMNGARYLMEDKEINIQPGTLMEVSKPLDLFPGFQLEGYPNRDSTIYKEKYGLDNVKTLLRGTLRYKNFADVCLAMLKLGCLDVSEKKGFEDGLSSNWNALMNNLIGTRELSETNLEIVVHDKIGKNGIGLQGLKKLGLLSRDAVVVTKGTPLDTLSYYLSKRLAYGPGERDLVLLSHQVGIQWSDKKELRDISLVAYGDPKGHSAMAKTVSLPLAIASKMVLDGEVIQKGSVVPLSAEIYEPILKRLSMEGVTWSSVSSFD